MKGATWAIKNMDMVPIPGLMEISTMEILRTIYEMDKAKWFGAMGVSIKVNGNKAYKMGKAYR